MLQHPEVNGRGKNLSPLEYIDAFRGSHEELVRTVTSVYEEPSFGGLVDVRQKSDAAIGNSGAFFDHNFFRSEEKADSLVELSVSTLLVAYDELSRQMEEITPGSSRLRVAEEFKDDTIKKILESDSEAEDIAEGMINHYKILAANLVNTLMDSYKITRFKAAEDIKEERRQKLLNFAGVIVASYIGSKLAQVKLRK